MDSWGYSDTIMSYFILLWKSYLTTMSSGISVGVALAFATATLLVLGLVFLIRRIFRLRKFRIKRLIRTMKGKRMSVTDREEYEKSLIADGVDELLDELFLLGKITADKRKWWRVKIGQKLDIQDLLRDSEASVKEQIKRRLKKEHGKVIEFPKKAEEPRLKRFTGGKLFKKKA